MARPTKQGIDYFPLDVQFDNKTELYLMETKAPGLAVIITLWQLIYQNDGYYIEASKDLHLLIRHRIDVDIEGINVCINSMLERNIFDKNIYNNYGVLTSRAVQKRYFDAAKRKKIIKCVREYLLIDLDNFKNIVYVDINSTTNGINVDKNPTKTKLIGINDVGNATNVNVDVDVKEKELYPPNFQKFWKAYPKKVGKGAAAKQYKNISSPRPTLKIILEAINKQKQTEQWQNKKYIPNPATWLSQRRWEDETTTSNSCLHRVVPLTPEELEKQAKEILS